jgi:DNA-binding MarR family transcriptional regulator
MDMSLPVDELKLAAGLGRVSSLMRSLSVPRDLSMTTLSTLATLERFGPRRLTELATLEGVTQPAMTQIVSRLEREGLAERRGEPTDGRVVVVRITEAGRADLARRREAQAALLAALLAELSEADRAAIAAALPALDRLTARAAGPAAGERTAPPDAPAATVSTAGSAE